MKHLILALFILFICGAYSCQECRDCTRDSLDCGYCNLNGTSTVVICDSTSKTDYENARDTCALKSGSWIKTSDNVFANRKVCATESKIDAEIASYKAQGYICN